MTHLTPSEFVDFAEGALDPSRADHVEGCAACRAQGSLVRDALQLTVAADADRPEPSPLYWDHLSARVRERIAEERPTPAWRWFGDLGRVQIAAAAATVVAVIAVAVLTRDARIDPAPPQPGAVSARAATAADQDVEAALDAGDAAVWAVLTAAAADMQVEDATAAGLAVHPAVVDRAVQRLSRAELDELGRLLQSELKRSGN